MSKIKEIRSNEENNINLAKIFECFCEEKPHKYLPFLMSFFKPNFHDVDRPQLRFQLEKQEVYFNDDNKNLNHYEFDYLVNKHFHSDDLEKIKNIQKFISHYEKNRIKEDLNNIKSYSQILNILNVVELTLEEKELEKQITKIYEDNEWLVLKPLTWEASIKYGKNTKWCTSSTDTGRRHYFAQWASNGILIYTINKKTGLKVATHFRFSDRELTFWDQIDVRIDSMMSNIDPKILGIIKDHIISSDGIANITFNSEDDFDLGDDRIIVNEAAPPLTVMSGNITQNFPLSEGYVNHANNLLSDMVDNGVNSEGTEIIKKMGIFNDTLTISSSHIISGVDPISGLDENIHF
jgi:hypothetical protein